MTLPLSHPPGSFGAEGDVDDAPRAGLEELRVPSDKGTLFLFPGGEGDPTELDTLVRALGGGDRVCALAPDYGPETVPTVEAIAERALGAIRARQPTGPYLLGGYSFGGLIALEVAQRLTATGEPVAQLFLIDAIYGERFWPRSVWLRALARRTSWHLSEIARMGPTAGVREVRLRSTRLVARLRARGSSVPTALPGTAVDPRTAQALEARAAYRPRRYAGTMTIVAPSEDGHSGCDVVRVWAGYADRIVVDRIDGDHLTMMQDEAGIAVVARAIDRHLTPRPSHRTGLWPMQGFERPLIVTTMRWFSAARLSHSLVEAGFTVSACRPRGHSLEAVDGLAGNYHLNRLWRRRSLLSAIRRSRPDIILADDERSLSLLRRLHSEVLTDDPDLAALIAHSLGCDWPSITSRAAFATDARASGIAAPETAQIADIDEIEAWAARTRYPIVLKTDGSWGGRGVAIVRDAAHLRRVWPRISGPPSLPRALKRTIFNLEAGYLFAWLRRSRPVVNVQEFVDGHEATVTAACLDGKVDTLRCFDVLQVTEPRGPAAVVQIVDHTEMESAVRLLVERYHMSGFCGFDFILAESGGATLIEVNPRVTPTAHLLVEGACENGRIITLFPPAAVAIDRSGAPLAGGLDVPDRAPWLVRRGEAAAARERRALRRWRKRRVTQVPR